MKQKGFISHNDLRKIIIAVIFFVVFIGFFVYYSYSSFNSLRRASEEFPPRFVQAKDVLINLSKNLSSQNNMLASKIADIKEMEKKNPAVALSLIDEAKTINNSIKKDADNFVKQLTYLEKSLNDFNDPTLIKNLSNAIAIEKELMHEFNAYAVLMEEFLNRLAISIKQPTILNKRSVEDTLKLLNEKISRINTLNASFNENLKELMVY